MAHPTVFSISDAGVIAVQLMAHGGTRRQLIIRCSKCHKKKERKGKENHQTSNQESPRSRNEVLLSVLSSVYCDTCPKIPPASPLKPKATTFPLTDIIWLGKEDKNVIAMTKRIGQEAGGLWISEDGADTWTNKTQLLYDSMLNTINDLKLNSSKTEPVEVIAIFPQNSSPSTVLFAGAGSYHWVSVDSGKSFTSRNNGMGWKGADVKFFKIHPWMDSTAMAMVKRPGCKAFSPDSCPYDLLVTQKLYSTTEGSTSVWMNLTQQSSGFIGGFVDAEWSAALCPGGGEECKTLGVGELKSDLTIFATFYKVPGSFDEDWDPDLMWGASSDFFKTIDERADKSKGHKIAFCGNLFQVVGPVIYLSYANSCPTDIYGVQRFSSKKGVSLYTSIDGGETFNLACIPVALKQDGYEMFSTQDNTGVDLVVDFLINDRGENLPASSVYTAGPHHAIFSMSLPDVYRADFGYSSDFARIEGLPGVFIANQLVPRGDDEDESSYQYDASAAPPLVQTRISFNGGGKWQPIDHSNANFNFDKCNRCSIDYGKKCALHLRGISSYDNQVTSWPAVYSSSSAVGYILATGIVAPQGYGLEDDTAGVCTWLSTDGGVTWKDVADEPMTYEFADFGGVIVMAKHPGQKSVPATEVKVSTDGGNCWMTLPLSRGLFVDNIKIEPDGQRARVVVYGVECDTKLDPSCTYDDTKVPRQGVMYTVDVEELTKAKVGKCRESDYESWSVSTSALDPSPRCILGQVMKIKRRIPSNSCFNGPDFVRPPYENATCACTLDDVECDYGYVRTLDGCSRINSDYMQTSCPYLSSGQYKVSSSGLRIVHADVCTGIEAIISDTDGKGGGSSGGGGGGDIPTASPPPPEVIPDHGGGGGGGGGGEDHGGGGSNSKKGTSGPFIFGMILLSMVISSGLFAVWWIFAAQPRQRDMIRDGTSSALGLASILVITVYENIKGGIESMTVMVTNRSPQYSRVQNQDRDMEFFTPLAPGEYSHA